jgi:hypothetical protein
VRGALGRSPPLSLSSLSIAEGAGEQVIERDDHQHQ